MIRIGAHSPGAKASTGMTIVSFQARGVGGIPEGMHNLEKYEVNAWMAKANCLGRGEELDIPEGRSGSYPAGAITGLRDSVTAICGGCPVMAECWSSASAEDRAWTVRGGVLPVHLREHSTYRGRAKSVAEMLAKGLCMKGKHYKTAPGKCVECEIERHATPEYREKKRLRRQADRDAEKAAKMAE